MDALIFRDVRCMAQLRIRVEGRRSVTVGKPRSHPRVKRMLSHSLPGLRSGWAAPRARAEPAHGLHSRPDGRARWIGTFRAELARLVGLGAPFVTQHPQNTFSASVHPRELLRSRVRHSVASEVLNLNDEKKRDGSSNNLSSDVFEGGRHTDLATVRLCADRSQ